MEETPEIEPAEAQGQTSEGQASEIDQLGLF
jgi:hypothetical protein